MNEVNNLIVTPTSGRQKLKSDKYGYNNVTVDKIDTEDIEIKLDFSSRDITINVDENKNIKNINIKKDENLKEENIRKGTTEKARKSDER